MALDTLADQREYHLSTTQDETWNRSHAIRTAARKAVMELDARARLDHALWCFRRARRCGSLVEANFGSVTLGKYSSCPSDRAGIEATPHDLLEAKTRLRYDSEKMQYVDVAEESEVQKTEEPDAESVGPPDGRELPTEIPVPDLPVPPDDGSGKLVRPPDERELPAEIPVPDLVVPLENVPRDAGGQVVPAVDSARSQVSFLADGSSESSGGSSSSSSGSSSSSSSTPRAPTGRPEWPPSGSGTVLKKWSRYDVKPTRFRTSKSKGPMWSDAVQRI